MVNELTFWEFNWSLVGSLLCVVIIFPFSTVICDCSLLLFSVIANSDPNTLVNFVFKIWVLVRFDFPTLLAIV